MQNLIIEKTLENQYKKRGKWIRGNCNKAICKCVGKCSAQKQKATATLENVVDVFYLEHGTEMKLSTSLQPLSDFV